MSLSSLEGELTSLFNYLDLNLNFEKRSMMFKVSGENLQQTPQLKGQAFNQAGRLTLIKSV